jgi:hypothetical protein
MTDDENMCLSEFWHATPFTNETLLAVFKVLTKMDGKNTIGTTLQFIELLHGEGYKVTSSES